MSSLLEPFQRSLAEIPWLKDLPFPPLYLLLGVLLLFLASLFLLVLRSLRSQRYEILPPGYRTRAHYKAYRQGQRHEERGEKTLAASFYVQAGLWERAVHLYREAQDHRAAARLLLQQGRKREAAEELEKGKAYREAGELYEKLKLYPEAERAYLKGGASLQALEMWRKLERYQELGELALKVKDAPAFEEALKLHDRPAVLVELAMNLFRHELAEGEGGLEPPEFWDPLLKRLLETTEALEQWEYMREIASYLGEWGKAAFASEKLGFWDEAEKLYHRVGDFEALARVLEKKGEAARAALVKAEQKEKEGSLAEAASLYEQAGEYRRAFLLFQLLERWEDCGRLALTLGEKENAADFFERAQQYEKALELYEELEKWGEAARSAVLLNQRERAAQYYRKAGLWVEAAKMMEKDGNLRAAITDLQQALRLQGWDVGIARHLAFLMMGSGMGEAAVPLLERIVPTHPTQPEDAELLYQLAMLLENEGRVGEAIRHYERLLVYDLNFRDVPERLKRLKASFTQAFLPQTPPPQPEAVRASSGDTQKLSERYEILEELGRGGMGIVFKARDQLLDRLVALKVVRLEDVTEGSRERLLTEARLAAKLNHPNIVQIYDCAFARGFLTLAMEYVEGKSLREILAQEGPLPVSAALLIIGQVCKALEYAHAQKIVHRDVKPANILWTAHKVAKLTDFGIARMVQDLKTTRTLVVGTPLYMAPEQITGRGVDHRADLYSLGVTFYELLTGAPPFPHGDVGYHHIHTPPPDPRALRPELNEALVSLLMKLLAKDPEQRFGSAREVLEALKRLTKRGS